MGFIMATLYQNKGHWLLTVHHKGRRLTKSLGTKDKKVAKYLKPYVESELLLELTGLKKATSQVAFPVLTDKFLKADKKRSPKTQELYEYVLRTYNSGKPLPLNPNSRAIFVRTINSCWKVFIIKKTFYKNFGTFYLKKKSKRVGRNPKNKKIDHEISERNVVIFKPSELLKKKLNIHVGQ